MSTQAARLTHSTFYKACEAMKTHRERFAKDRPNNRRAAAMLSDLAGFQISEASIAEIKEACGIDWEPARKTPQKPDNHFKDRAIRTLARALRLLYRKLDEEMPSTLQDLCSYFDGKTESADATVSGHRQS